MKKIPKREELNKRKKKDRRLNRRKRECKDEKDTLERRTE